MIATIWKGCVPKPLGKAPQHDGKRVLLVRLAGSKRVSYKLLFEDELHTAKPHKVPAGRRRKAA